MDYCHLLPNGSKALAALMLPVLFLILSSFLDGRALNKSTEGSSSRASLDQETPSR